MRMHMKNLEAIKQYANINFIVSFDSFLTKEVADNHCDWDQNLELTLVSLWAALAFEWLVELMEVTDLAGLLIIFSML